jgi:hypothetical protein
MGKGSCGDRTAGRNADVAPWPVLKQSLGGACFEKAKLLKLSSPPKFVLCKPVLNLEPD